MKAIGLTGGIGSGKTTVSQLFAQLGVPVIDADVIARDITHPGYTAYEQIHNRWGADCFTANGDLDRSALRSRVFSNSRDLAELEDILHPAIEAEIENRKKQLAKENHAYCLIVIPLLVEKKWQHLVDKLIVVDIPEALQIERTMQRGTVTQAQLESILSSQATREERLLQADFVIDNSGEPEELSVQVSGVDADLRAIY